jgi:hypothetical protein
MRLQDAHAPPPLKQHNTHTPCRRMHDTSAAGSLCIIYPAVRPSPSSLPLLAATTTTLPRRRRHPSRRLWVFASRPPLRLMEVQEEHDAEPSAIEAPRLMATVWGSGMPDGEGPTMIVQLDGQGACQ